MKKLILIGLFTSSLLADCFTSASIASKESKKVIEYFNNGMYDEICFESKIALHFLVNAKIECDGVERIDGIEKTLKEMKEVNKRYCK